MLSRKLKSIVFLGSKPIGYECLAHLIAMQQSLDYTISGVLTRRRKEFSQEADISALAQEAGIPLLETLQDVPDCDIIYSVQHHEILKQETIGKARQIAVNLHMAPLPEYRGCNQFSMAILDGKKTFGTTLHRIDTRIDHGDILFQERFPVPDGCWVNDLYELTFAASLALFKETLPSVIAGDYPLIAQQTLEAEHGTALHFRDEIAALKQIDLSWDAEKINRHIRATSMPGFEPPYTLIGGEKVYFTTQYP